MEDPIAYVWSYDSNELANETIRHEANAPRLRYTRSGKLVLRLRDIPGTNEGLVFGTSSSAADIRLPNAAGMGERHFALAIDEHNRLLVKTMDGHMVSVAYTDQFANRFRSDFSWIIAGSDFLDSDDIRIVVRAKGTTETIALGMQVSWAANDMDLLPQDMARLRMDNIPDESERPPTAMTKPHWCLKRTLGNGAYGMVWRAFNVHTGFDTAMKRVKAPYHPPAGMVRWREESRQEGAMLQNLRHANIITCYGLLDMEVPEPAWVNSIPTAILEYTPHGDMEQFLRSNRVEGTAISDVEAVLFQMLSALDYLHTLEPVPIIHRDVKPLNILVASVDPLVLKLADFGLSQHAQILYATVGTAQYCSPEMLLNRPYTARADIWALGVTAAEVMVQDLPVYEDDYPTDGWAHLVLEFFTNHMWEMDDDSGLLMRVILDRMVVWDPRERCPAWECVEELVAHGFHAPE